MPVSIIRVSKQLEEYSASRQCSLSCQHCYAACARKPDWDQVRYLVSFAGWYVIIYLSCLGKSYSQLLDAKLHESQASSCRYSDTTLWQTCSILPPPVCHVRCTSSLLEMQQIWARVFLVMSCLVFHSIAISPVPLGASDWHLKFVSTNLRACQKRLHQNHNGCFSPTRTGDAQYQFYKLVCSSVLMPDLRCSFTLQVLYSSRVGD